MNKENIGDKVFLIILICCLFPPIIVLYPLFKIIENIIPHKENDCSLILGVIFFIILSLLIILLIKYPII